ncbi:MAG: tetratricopeptide repeat protein [Gammaproteobacteria bacterium]|nr:tetratricopeptide repeat protein [Gammaproteobacteria bacterium]
MKRAKDIRLPVALITITVVLALGAAFTFNRGHTAMPSAAHQTDHIASGETDPLQSEFQYGVQLLRTSHPDLAISTFVNILRRAPHLPEAYANLGYAFLVLRRYADAQAQFERALNINMRQLNAYYGLALAHEGRGDLEKALGAMKTFVHLADEKDPFVRKARSAIWEWESAQETGKGGS